MVNRDADGKFVKLANWLLEHTVHTQAVMLVLAIFLSVFFTAKGLTNELIISIVLLFVGEFFLQSVGYLDTIKRHTTRLVELETAKTSSSIRFIQRYQSEMRDLVLSAENDVFISGANLGSLQFMYDIFESWSSKIHLRLMSLDLDNEEMLSEFSRMVHRNLSPEVLRDQGKGFRDVYIVIKDMPNVEIAASDRIMPYVFVAIDVLKASPHSCIKIQHYLHEQAAATKTISYALKPDSSAYEILREQIDTLWKNKIEAKHMKRYV